MAAYHRGCGTSVGLRNCHVKCGHRFTTLPGSVGENVLAAAEFNATADDTLIADFVLGGTTDRFFVPATKAIRFRNSSVSVTPPLNLTTTGVSWRPGLRFMVPGTLSMLALSAVLDGSARNPATATICLNSSA